MRSAVALPEQPGDDRSGFVTLVAERAAHDLIEGVRLYQAAEQAESGEVRAQALARAGDILQRSQSYIGAGRIAVEGDLGAAIQGLDAPTLRRIGVSSQRASAARRLDQLSMFGAREVLESGIANSRDVTPSTAKLAATPTPRSPKANLPESYSAPPIDIEIAREFGLLASDYRAQMLVDSIQRALNSMDNPKHAYVWAKYHGINDDGTVGECLSAQGIAQLMGGVTREYVESLYYRASHHVRGQMLVDALTRM